MKMRATFPKSEKLCGQLAVDHLYKNGKRFVVWPLRVTYIPVATPPTQVLVWAPKSLFKHATDRNRLRRKMREAYRLNKQILAESDTCFQIAINYIDKQQVAYSLRDKAMRKVLQRLTQTKESQV